MALAQLSTIEMQEMASLTQIDIDDSDNPITVGQRITYDDKEYLVLKVTPDSSSGFAGITLYDETAKKAYIIPKGSVPLTEINPETVWINDWIETNIKGFGEDNISAQMKDSIDFAIQSLDAIKSFEESKDYTNTEIVATGHSLAGGEVELWSMLDNFSKSNIKLYTFNAAPAGNLYDDLVNYASKNGLVIRKDTTYNNLYNFSVQDDLVSDLCAKLPWLKHVGKVYELYSDLQPISSDIIDTHSIENFTHGFAYLDIGYDRDTLGDNISTLFKTAEATFQRVDPLVLDLDGDGVETTTVANGQYFDMDNNGFAENTAWVGNDDGILALDKNLNGVIDNGSEFFGDQTILANGQLAANGFAALLELDSNSNGKIDSSDAQFVNLKVLKGDGTNYKKAA